MLLKRKIWNQRLIVFLAAFICLFCLLLVSCSTNSSNNQFIDTSGEASQSDVRVLDAVTLIRGYLAVSNDFSGYPEYLNEQEKKLPGSIGKRNQTLSDFLSQLQNTEPGEGDVILKGSLPSETCLLGGNILPSDTIIEVNRWGGINAAARGDFTSGVFRVNGGRHTKISIESDDNGVYLNRFHLAKDINIQGIPARAEPMNQNWDYTIELFSNGQLRRLVLAEAWSWDDVEFDLQEKLQLDEQGCIERAFIKTARSIRGHDALPFAPYGTLPAFTGFSGPQSAAPNIYFKNGKLSWCFEKGKTLGRRLIEETLAYGYASDEKTVINIFTPTGVFLGYPVLIQGWYGWDSEPPETITIDGNKARFPVDVDLNLIGSGKTFVVAKKSLIEVDITTGACIKVTTPEGSEISFKSEAGMVPEFQGSEAQCSVNWAQNWLSLPEAKNDWYLAVLHESILQAAEQEMEFERQYDEIMNACIAKGFITQEGDRYAIDRDGDKKTIMMEYLPQTTKPLMLIESVAAAAGNFTTGRQTELVSLFYEYGSRSFRLEEISPVQRKIDILGAALEKKGIHAIEKWKSYYLPDGSGNKAVGVGFVEFGSNGMVKTLREKYDPGTTQGGTPLMLVRLPDGRDALTRDAFWYENTGKLQSVSISDGSVDSKLPNGDWICGWGPGYFEDGSISYFGGTWGGHEFTLPWGFETREMMSISFYKNGQIEHVWCGEWVRLPVTAGQKIPVKDFRNKKPLTLIIDHDKVIEGKFECKVWFNESGQIKDISLWSDEALNALGVK